MVLILLDGRSDIWITSPQDDIIPPEKEAMATLLANEIMTLIYHGAILAKVWMFLTISIVVSLWRTAGGI